MDRDNPPADSAASSTVTTSSDAAATTPARRREPVLGIRLIVTVTALAVAAALTAGWWVGSRSAAKDSVSPDQLLSGEARSKSSVTGTAKVGAAAPATSFTYLDGTSGSLATFSGTPILLNFWSSTCAPCLREMPALEQVAQERAGALVVIGVDVTDSIDAGTKMVERTGVTYPIVRDPDGSIMAAFGGRQLPHSVMIDANGTVTALRDGAMDLQEIRDLVGS